MSRMLGFVILILACLVSPAVWAACGKDASYAQDQAMFQRRLRMLKERVAGYDDFQKEKDRLEKERLKGVAAFKKRREKQEKEQARIARAHGVIRQREERAQRQLMAKAWKTYAKEKRARRQQLRCAREAYVRARNKFSQAEQHIRAMTEEKELNMVSR